MAEAKKAQQERVEAEFWVSGAKKGQSAQKVTPEHAAVKFFRKLDREQLNEQN